MSFPTPFFSKATLDVYVKLIPSYKNVDGGRNGPGVALVSTHVWIQMGKHSHLLAPAERTSHLFSYHVCVNPSLQGCHPLNKQYQQCLNSVALKFGIK